jgi:hypothetical protein
MEPKGSLSCLKGPNTKTLSEASPHNQTLFILSSILILSSHQCLRLRCDLLLLKFVTSPMRGTCTAQLILLNLITDEDTINYEAPHYAIFFVLLLYTVT